MKFNIVVDITSLTPFLIFIIAGIRPKTPLTINPDKRHRGNNNMNGKPEK